MLGSLNSSALLVASRVQATKASNRTMESFISGVTGELRRAGRAGELWKLAEICDPTLVPPALYTLYQTKRRPFWRHSDVIVSLCTVLRAIRCWITLINFRYRAILLAVSFCAAFIQTELRLCWCHSDAIVTLCWMLQTIRSADRITFINLYHRGMLRDTKH